MLFEFPHNFDDENKRWHYIMRNNNLMVFFDEEEEQFYVGFYDQRGIGWQIPALIDEEDRVKFTWSEEKTPLQTITLDPNAASHSFTNGELKKLLWTKSALAALEKLSEYDDELPTLNMDEITRQEAIISAHQAKLKAGSNVAASVTSRQSGSSIFSPEADANKFIVSTKAPQADITDDIRARVQAVKESFLKEDIFKGIFGEHPMEKDYPNMIYVGNFTREMKQYDKKGSKYPEMLAALQKCLGGYSDIGDYVRYQEENKLFQPLVIDLDNVARSPELVERLESLVVTMHEKIASQKNHPLGETGYNQKKLDSSKKHAFSNLQDVINEAGSKYTQLLDERRAKENEKMPDIEPLRGRPPGFTK